MKRSKALSCLKKVKFFTIVFILGNLSLVGCGQHSTLKGPLSLQNAGTGTASFDDEGNLESEEQRPYLSLTPEDEVDTIKQSVAENSANKQFASQIVTASINRIGVYTVVQIPTTISNIPLIFKDKLTAQDGRFVGNFAEASQNHPDLVLYISCTDQTCHHADLFLADQQGHKAAIVVSTEDRILHTTIPDGETEDQVKSSGLEKFAQDTKVHYNLTEIYPGKSSYSVTTIESDPTKTKTLFAGTIQNTEDGLVPTDLDSTDQTEKASLAGVDADHLVLQVETNPDPVKKVESRSVIYDVRAQEGVTVRPKPIVHNNPTSTVSVPEKCPVRLGGDVNPMVNDILKECNQDWVSAGITWWKTLNLNGFKNIMSIYHENKSARDPKDVVKVKNQMDDFKVMVNLLHAQGFPTVWSWVTEVESSFNKEAVPKHSIYGERGVWQITTRTRAGLKMSEEDAKKIVPATNGAMTLYKSLLSKYPHNIPMVLAGYNAGEGGPKNMQILINAGVGQDFWQLCGMSLEVTRKKGSKLPTGGTCGYVAEIISGMIIGLDPEVFGMPNIGAMEAK